MSIYEYLRRTQPHILRQLIQLREDLKLDFNDFNRMMQDNHTYRKEKGRWRQRS